MSSLYSRHYISIEIFFLFFLNLLLKGLYLSEAGIGGDECFSVYYSQLPVAKIIAILSKGNNPPLHEIILHFWTNVFGIDEWAFRFPSYLFSCLSIIPLYLMGERFVKRGVGLVAVLIFSFSSYSLFLSHDARVYNLVLFLTCCSFFVFLNLIDRNRRYILWLVLVLLNAALLYSHYLAVWVIVVQGVAVLTHRQLRGRILFLFSMHSIGLLLLFFPFLPVVFMRFLDSGVNGTWVSEVTGLGDFYNMLWTFSNKPLVTVVFVAVIILAAFLVLFKKEGGKIFQPHFFVILLWVWLPLVISFLLSFRNGFFLDKYMFFTSPAYYLFVATASIYIGKRLFLKYQFILPLVCIALMALTFSIHSIGAKYSGGKGNLSNPVGKISALNKSGVPIFVCPDWFDKDIVYYLDRKLFTTYFAECDSDVVFKIPLLKKNIYQVKNKDAVNMPYGTNTLAYLDNASDFHFPGNGILNKLNHEYTMKDSFHFDQNIVIYLFENK